MDVSDKLHAPATLSPGKQSPVPIGWVIQPPVKSLHWLGKQTE